MLCECLRHLAKVAEEGLERLVRVRGTMYVLTKVGDHFRESALVNPPLDPQLQLLILRWPTLSKAVQQQIVLYLSSVSPWNCQATHGRQEHGCPLLDQ